MIKSCLSLYERFGVMLNRTPYPGKVPTEVDIGGLPSSKQSPMWWTPPTPPPDSNDVIQCHGCGARDNIYKHTHVECAYCGNQLRIFPIENKIIKIDVGNVPIKEAGETIDMIRKFGIHPMHCLNE